MIGRYDDMTICVVCTSLSTALDRMIRINVDYNENK